MKKLFKKVTTLDGTISAFYSCDCLCNGDCVNCDYQPGQWASLHQPDTANNEFNGSFE